LGWVRPRLCRLVKPKRQRNGGRLTQRT